MILETLLRWLICMVQPFYGWRVPVALLRGSARGSGKQVTLLAAGSKRWTQFIKQHFFAGEPEVVRMVRVPVWSLQKRLNEWQSSADLTVVGIDRVSAGLFLERGCLRVPFWITSWMQVPDDLKAFGRTHGHAAADMQRVRNNDLEHRLSHANEDLDEFYDRFYVPYISHRHDVGESLASRWMIRFLFKHGGLMWVIREDQRLAGGITMVQGKKCSMGPIGLRDGRLDLLRQGALAAIYVHSIQHARQAGCTRLFMGGSRPSLHDGVLHYKSKWAGGLCAHGGHLSSNFVMLLRWNRLDGPVAEFLSHTSLIHHDHDGYSALWVFPSDVPLTADNLRKHHRDLNAAGLRRFRILLPGDPPPDFECPPEVRLISLESMAHGGPEMLQTFA
ncbi:hypothetical protein [Prosthecobacter sp.]|uniref:hypothetical protein n=1 Tax=Prosthecobacter sp. TaxID=1965333 RepID=UPI002AB9DEBF|nr:hypothetical protein [Prosthecobacter sp.]MDZ4405899.1 hypothetical protein [Prosthecobacter sp.]